MNNLNLQRRINLVALLLATSLLIACDHTKSTPRDSLDFGGIAATGRSIKDAATSGERTASGIYDNGAAPRSSEALQLRETLKAITARAATLETEVRVLRQVDARNKVDEEEAKQAVIVAEEKASRANKAIWSRNALIAGLLLWVFRGPIMGIIQFLWRMLVTAIRPI